MRFPSRCLAVLLAIACAACDTSPHDVPLRTPQLRGVIEAFYGEPYAFEDRLAILTALPAAGFSAYFYGPKDDPLHRDAWRDPYPEAYLDHFATLAAAGREIGVRFVFTISPGLSYDPALGDRGVLEAKLDVLVERGVRDFCIFFDDLYPSSSGADPLVQVELLRAIRRHLRARDPEATLCVTPAYYFGTASALARDVPRIYPLALPDPSSVYYAAYASLPADVAIFWTGPGIFSPTITEEDVTAYRAFVGRPTYLWDNFPVNDAVLVGELFLGPYLGRSAALGTSLDGVVLNLAREPRASLLAVATAGAALSRGAAYDPDAAHAAALEVMGGPVAPSLPRLAEHCAGHPFIADDGESVRFLALADAFSATPTSETEGALRDELGALAAVDEDLASGLPDQRLAAELAPYATKLGALADVALTALDAYDDALAGDTVDLAALDASITSARALPTVVGANTPIPEFLFSILGDGTTKPHVDVWQDVLATLRSMIVAADAAH